MKHTILYVAANPLDTDRLALDEECAAIERELRMTSGRDDFDFRSKWAVSVDDLMRHLNELQPTILHFSGHGSNGAAGSAPAGCRPYRDVEAALGAGIYLQEGQGSQYVSERALAKLIASAAPSTRVVVLNACYGAAVAESLCHEVDCVVGMDGAIADIAARSFAVAFYRALGHHRSIGNAVAQAAATLDVKHPGARPVCATRDGLRADQIFLPAPERASDPAAPPPQTEDRRMTREELLTRLSRLLPSQFEEVLFRVRIPAAYLPGAGAAQAMRAIEAIRYLEQQDQLEQLARVVGEVAPAGNASGCTGAARPR